MTTGTTRFSTVEEVATVLRLSKMSVYRLIHTGEIPAHRFGRNFRIPTKAVWAYLQGSLYNPLDLEHSQALDVVLDARELA
jgi:excisionase family DNA binding protein